MSPASPYCSKEEKMVQPEPAHLGAQERHTEAEPSGAVGATFTRAQSEAAKSLAVAYEAYTEAKRIGPPNAVRVWGRALIEAQQATSVNIIDSDIIEDRIARSFTGETA